MPSIEILEKDLTSGGSGTTNFNIVFVPGFMSTTKGGKAKKNNPILCNTLKEFEEYFGTEPATFESSGEGTSETSVDKSYIYAKELLNLGLPVLYESLNEMTDTPDKTAMDSNFTTDNLAKFEDKGDYQFKYFTSGGYAINTNSVAAVVTMVTNRADCLFLLDHSEEINSAATLKTYYEGIQGATYGDYCAAFTPWVNVDCTTYAPKDANGKKLDNTVMLPPSFAYLSALAKSIKTNASWLAVAGATRGQIPNLNVKNPVVFDISNSLAESLQSRGKSTEKALSINAITNIKPFGYRIWGNRTLKNNSIEGDLTATSFINIRNMICDVKKVVYEACRKYTFEQNNDVLWLNFKAAIEPTLNQMKTGAGLSGYKVIKVDTDEKAKLKAQIKLYPLYAVEDFTVEVLMLDEEIAVS